MTQFIGQCFSYLKRNARVLSFLFLVAFLHRLVFFATHVSFTQDQVRDVLLVRKHLQDKDFYIPLGPAAASYSNFSVLPLYYYLQLLSHLMFGDVFYAMAIFTMLIESITTVLIFFLLTKVGMSRTMSVLGALLYAVAPGTVLLAVWAWNPNLVPFFTTTLLIGSFLYILEQRKGGLLIALLSFVFLLNLHFQWFVLVPLMGILALVALRRIRTSWKVLLVGLLSSLVLLSPYLHFELTHQWQNLRASLDYLNSGAVVFERISKPVYVLFFFPTFFARVLFDTVFAYHWTWLYESYVGPEVVLVILSIVFWIIVLRSAVIGWKHRSRVGSRWSLGLLGLFAVMAITLRFYKGDKPDYFLNAFIPFVFVWLFQGLDAWRWKRFKLVVAVMAIGLALFAVWNRPFVNQYRDFQSMAQTIQAFPGEKEVVILHQELEVPVRYFLNDDLFSASPSAKTTQTIFLCYAHQNCRTYEPNTVSASNVFKYDLVTPINYGVYFEGYDAKASGGWRIGGLEAFRVVSDPTKKITPQNTEGQMIAR